MQVTVIGVDPVALLFMQPGMRFPATINVTLPVKGTDIDIEELPPLYIVEGTVRATEIAWVELFVIVREVTSAIKFP